jgi:hypothetical protein
MSLVAASLEIAGNAQQLLDRLRADDESRRRVGCVNDPQPGAEKRDDQQQTAHANLLRSAPARSTRYL